ncbi:derlin-1-like [Nymphaea colorata]|nr:derlin-1-like [Nymphaea colorata]XP_049934344.1 derlin-1-like [Nymphaea colorata]
MHPSSLSPSHSLAVGSGKVASRNIINSLQGLKIKWVLASVLQVSKTYGTICALTTTVFHLGLVNPYYIALIYSEVLQCFQAFSIVLQMMPFFLGVSLVFMLLYVWSRAYLNGQINIYGLVTLKAFYLPWIVLALDVIFGSPLLPHLMGIVAGHHYYFLTVLHPSVGGRNP